MGLCHIVRLLYFKMSKFILLENTVNEVALQIFDVATSSDHLIYNKTGVRITTI